MARHRIIHALSVQSFTGVLVDERLPRVDLITAIHDGKNIQESFHHHHNSNENLQDLSISVFCFAAREKQEKFA